jgi:hypothetical protein
MNRTTRLDQAFHPALFPGKKQSAVHRRNILVNRRGFLAQASTWAPASALPKLSGAVADPSLKPSAGQRVSTEQIRFPKDFLWGAETAAYQVEGGWNLDGRGECVWDRFSHSVGNVKGGYTGDIACDDYHRYPEDIVLMKQMNLRSYRYSLAWPRIQLTGEGAGNQKGIDYYKRLTDAVLAAGMRPLVILYHWDLPQALEDKGGWPNRDTAGRFADYTEIVPKALGDRIQTWAIFNEPWVFTYVGYGSGVHAPGKKDFDLFLKAAHTVQPCAGRLLPCHQGHRTQSEGRHSIQHVSRDTAHAVARGCGSRQALRRIQQRLVPGDCAARALSRRFCARRPSGDYGLSERR